MKMLHQITDKLNEKTIADTGILLVNTKIQWYHLRERSIIVIQNKRRDCIIREHTERSLVPKSGVKSDKISTWVFSMQISEPICKKMIETWVKPGVKNRFW
jgi:hypothetical protein